MAASKLRPARALSDVLRFRTSNVPSRAQPFDQELFYLLTGLLFKGTVDVSYKFRFGPWRTQCRRNDAAMAK
jgi:hypothetical protein